MNSCLKLIPALAVCSLIWTADVAKAQYDMGAPPSQNEGGPPDDGSGPPPDQGDQGNQGDQGAPDNGTSFQTFYDTLGSQGTWIQTNDYGYVFQPQVNDPDWAPYTDGHWVYSDQGWTWVTDEPWGWATYHYGRWVNLDGTGWCWVPGYTWAPAWVSWRYSDDYCGWAPLPPDSFVGIDYGDNDFAIGIGFHIGGDCDSYYGIGAGCYHFLPVNCLGYRDYHGRYAHRGDNFAIINHTTNVTNINVAQHGANSGGGFSAAAHGGGFHHVTTGGPSFAQVNSISQTPVAKVNLVRSNQAGVSSLDNNSYSLYAPHMNGTSSANIHPAHVSTTLERTTVNRGTDVTRPLAVNQHLAPAAPSAAEIQQAQAAQANAPAHAKVITSTAQVKPVLNTPLTSMKPYSSLTSTHPQGSASYQRSGGSYNAAPSTSSTLSHSVNNAGSYPHNYQPQTTYPGTYSEPAHPRDEPIEYNNNGSSYTQPQSVYSPPHYYPSGGSPAGNPYSQTHTTSASSSAGSSTQSHPSSGGSSSSGGGQSHGSSGGGGSSSGGSSGGSSSGSGGHSGGQQTH